MTLGVEHFEPDSPQYSVTFQHGPFCSRSSGHGLVSLVQFRADPLKRQMRKRMSRKWEKADKVLSASGPEGAREAFDKQSTYEPQCPQERPPKQS